MSSGRLYWITGLAGAGKTTIGSLFANKLKGQHSNVIFLDGDSLREIFGDNTKYSLDERLALSRSYSRLCRMLVNQEMIVVCATISMFSEVRKWNRENIKNYKEIFLKVPIELLIERDQKKLYSRALQGEIKHVMGVDVPIEEPECPDIVIDNDGKRNALTIVELLIKLCRI